MERRPTAIDLFCGGGGLSIGLEQAGFNVLFGVDNWDYAVTAYEDNLNHPCHNLNLYDNPVTKVHDALRGRQPDVIAGGPPCQGFSTVGKRIDWDPRNVLLESFVEVVGAIQPSHFIMENVAGLLSSGDRNRAGRTIEQFVDAGYSDTKVSLVHAADYGIPQLRKRVIFTGSKDGESTFELPPPTTAEDARVSVSDAIFDLPHVGPGETASRHVTEPFSNYQRMLRNGELELFNHTAANHRAAFVEMMSHVPDGGNRSSIPNHLQPRSGFHNSYSRLDSRKPAVAITSNMRKPSSARCIHPTQNRGLTVREGLRLQSFPDSYVLNGPRTPQYNVVGNAVPPLLAKSLFEPLSRQLCAA